MKQSRNPSRMLFPLLAATSLCGICILICRRVAATVSLKPARHLPGVPEAKNPVPEKTDPGKPGPEKQASAEKPPFEEESARLPDADLVWKTLQEQRDRVYYTVKNLPFRCEVTEDGESIRPIRLTDEGEKPIQHTISKADFEKAIGLFPIPGPGSLKNVHGASYVYAVLTGRTEPSQDLQGA